MRRGTGNENVFEEIPYSQNVNFLTTQIKLEQKAIPPGPLEPHATDCLSGQIALPVILQKGIKRGRKG